MEKSHSSQGAPLIPPAYERQSLDSQGTDDAPHDLPFLAPLSHSHPLLSPSNPSSSWDPDSFLLSRLPVPLDELRSELRSYLASLKDELVGVINEDYEDFVGLGTGLKGEGKRLERLTGPLESLKEDVEEIRSSLVSNEEAVKSKLTERAHLRDEKNLLQILLDLTDSLTRTETLLSLAPPASSASTSNLSPSHPSSKLTSRRGSSTGEAEEKLVSRVASEYTRVLYLVEKAKREDCALVGEVEWRVERIRNTLNRDLDHLFSGTLSFLSSSSYGVTDKMKETLGECLKTYQLVGGWRDAEDLFRREMVRPTVRKIISADALHDRSSPSVPQTPYTSLKSNPFSPNVSTPSTPKVPHTPSSHPHGSSPLAFTSTTAAAVDPNNINPFDLPSSTSDSSLLDTQPFFENDVSPLANLLSRLLRELGRECSVVLEVAEKLRKVDRRVGGLEESIFIDRRTEEEKAEEGFELFGNVVWKEVGERLMDELGSVIFAAGRPDELHYHYALLQTFLSHFETTLAPSLPSLLHMRHTQTYRTFSTRWQLPVYFQLRFKAIAAELEESLRKASVVGGKGEGGFELKESAAVLRAIEGCWKEGVYIGEVGWRFWRLTLQIISRYQSWLDSIVPPLESSSFAQQPASSTPQPRTPATSGRSTPLPYAALASSASNPSPLSSNFTASGKNNPPDLPALSTDPAVLAEEEKRLRTACAVMGDLGKFENAVWGVWRRRIGIVLEEDGWDQDEEDEEDEDHDSDSAREKKGPEATLTQTLSDLSETFLPHLTNHIITHLIRHCSEPLRLIRSISSQYRSTSTSKSKPPTEPSYWVPNVFSPIQTFFASSSSSSNPSSGIGRHLRAEHGTPIARSVIKGVLQRYIATLLSIRAQEASLKRYRSSKPKTSSTFSLFGGSSSSAASLAAAAEQEKRDEENVRKQYELDVEGLRKAAEALGLGSGQDEDGEEGWEEAKAVAAGSVVEEGKGE